MEIDVYQKDGVTILKPDGNIFGVAALDFKKVLDGQIAKNSKSPKFLIDFAKVTLMGSSGLGALVGGYKAVDSKGGFIAIINVGTNVENLMIRSRLFDTFEHFDSEDEAIEALNAD